MLHEYGTPPAVSPVAAASPHAAPDSDDYDALLQFLYLAPVGLVQIGRSGEIAMLNPLSSRLLMPLAPAGDLTNLFDALDGVAPDLRHRISAFEPPYGLICDGLQVPVGPAGPDRREVQTLSISLLKLDDTRLMAVLSDVTEQVRRERLLRQNQAWLNAILDDIRDHCLVVLDANGQIDDWNPSIGRVTGFSRDQVVGKPFSILYPEGAAPPERLLDLLQEADDHGWSFDHGWRQRSDGSRFWGSSLISSLSASVSDPPGPSGMADDRVRPAARTALANAGYCLVIRDITDSPASSEGDRQSARSDPLTGIANRRAFFEAGEIAVARTRRSQRPVALVLVDVDGFRELNAADGLEAGDAVLCHLASLLTASVGDGSLVARIGGGRFAALMPSADLQVAAGCAERLCERLRAKPAEVGGRPLAYTVSAGAASASGRLATFDDLFERAGRALQDVRAGERSRAAGSAAG